jgi:hypothetical protein
VAVVAELAALEVSRGAQLEVVDPHKKSGVARLTRIGRSCNDFSVLEERHVGQHLLL